MEIGVHGEALGQEFVIVDLLAPLHNRLNHVIELENGTGKKKTYIPARNKRI